MTQTLQDVEVELRTELREMAETHERWKGRLPASLKTKPPRKYQNIYDLVAREGVFFKGRELPVGRRRKGAPGKCFANCRSRALSFPELTYCEGFGWTKEFGGIHHAWLIDERGGVIEPTWSRPEHNINVGDVFYLGIPFATEELAKLVVEHADKEVNGYLPFLLGGVPWK